MSCCVVEKQTSSAIKELDELKKHFDEVVVEAMPMYNLLTLRDKCNKANYDYIVWLQIKIAYAETNSCSHNSDEKIKGACKSILDWIPILKDFEKSDEGKQLSLFAEDDEDDLEKEPESPNGENGNWGKYHRECEKARKNNLMKQYSFFELFNSTTSWWRYQDIDFTRFLPKSNAEMIELVKIAIKRGTSSKDGHGRFEDYWWDDSSNYVCRDGALSDIELLNRVLMMIRLHLVPYKSYFRVFTDNSYSASELEEKTDYRFWFDGRKVNGSSWVNGDMPTYDLNDADFILWLRDFFNIEYKEVISDEDILKDNIDGLFMRVYGFENPSFIYRDEIKRAKNFKEFKAKALSFAKLGNGGGSGVSIDGFSGSYSLYKGRKGDVITIEQNIEQRISLNRDIEGLEKSDFRDNSVYVYKLNFDEVLEKAFELFKIETVKQTSIFDFLQAS
jgi:hypothetical protein